MGIDFLDLIFFGNSVRSWGFALVTALATFALLWLLRTILHRSLGRISSRTRTYLDDLAGHAVGAIRASLVFGISLGVGAQGLVLPGRTAWLIENIAILLVLLQIGISGVAVIRGHVTGYTERHIEKDASSVSAVRALGFLATVVLWAIVFLMALDNFGVEVTALIAGLGIGGIAVALAVQNILGDLFASLSIVLDKPFVYGDFIVVGDLSGSVERIGLKTTRLRSISGEQLVFSNSDLLQSRIHNYQRMQTRRVVMMVSVVQNTPVEELSRIPGTIREVVEASDGLRFDRAHLASLGTASIDFEVVYYVNSADFNLHMDLQQEILLGLIRRFRADEIAFALPTRTVHIAEPVVFDSAGAAAGNADTAEGSSSH